MGTHLTVLVWQLEPDERRAEVAHGGGDAAVGDGVERGTLAPEAAPGGGGDAPGGRRAAEHLDQRGRHRAAGAAVGARRCRAAIGCDAKSQEKEGESHRVGGK